jgi:hypothetical protein
MICLLDPLSASKDAFMSASVSSASSPALRSAGGGERGVGARDGFGVKERC